MKRAMFVVCSLLLLAFIGGTTLPSIALAQTGGRGDSSGGGKPGNDNPGTDNPGTPGGGENPSNPGGRAGGETPDNPGGGDPGTPGGGGRPDSVGGGAGFGGGSTSADSSGDNYNALFPCLVGNCRAPISDKSESCQTMYCRQNGKSWRVRLCVWHNFQGHPCNALNKR